MYANEVASGTCDGSAYPVAVRDVGATALVNGHNAVGPVVGNFAMRLAVDKARRFGVGRVTAHSQFRAAELTEFLLHFGLPCRPWAIFFMSQVPATFLWL